MPLVRACISHALRASDRPTKLSARICRLPLSLDLLSRSHTSHLTLRVCVRCLRVCVCVLATASMMKSMVHMLPPEMQAMANKISAADIASQLQSNADGASSGNTPAIDNYLKSQGGAAGGAPESADAWASLGSAAAPAAAPIALVALLASDVANATRLSYLSDCLRSVREQTMLPAQLIIGLSAAPEIYAQVKQVVTHAREAFGLLGCALRVRLSKSRLSQFEHYKAVSGAVTRALHPRPLRDLYSRAPSCLLSVRSWTPYCCLRCFPTF